MINIFEDDAFSSHSLTESINIVPYVPRRIGQMGLFTVKNPNTNVVFIERKGDSLAILETKPRGSGETTKRPATRRDMIPIMIPHVPLDDAVLASDFSGSRAFNEEQALESAITVTTEKLTGCRVLHEVTHEYHRIGAIKGILTDGDAAASELLNLFDAFSITQEEFYFDLEGSGEQIKITCMEIISYIEDVLGGQVYDHIHAMVGNTFFQQLVNNEQVAHAYSEQQGYKWQIEQQGSGTMGRGTNQVTFGDITFENYRGKVGDRNFVELTEGHFFPVGVPDLFQFHFGPADTMEDVNTAGKDVYAFQERMKFNVGIEIHTESNPLAICRRPKLLVLGHAEAEDES
jgi:hypothetical protein